MGMVNPYKKPVPCHAIETANYGIYADHIKGCIFCKAILIKEMERTPRESPVPSRGASA